MGSFVVGEVLGGKYEIKAVLGAGGMGTVYRARQMDLGRDVAIKVPMPAALEVPGFLARFSREARLVAKLVHDNIVQVYEYQESQDQVYIVMEYVEGQDMKALFARPPADLKVKDVALMLRAACEGLGHAHEGGIVHRDIKPHNIMVAQSSRGRWRVKIMDFGIAHLDANNSNMTMQQEQLTVTGQAIGTPSYMSPEQIRGSGVSHKSDIYSMGCVLFYSFTKNTPFQGTGFTVAAAHLSEPAPRIRERLPQLPEPLEQLILRCLEKDPSLRPEDASTVGEELYAALTPIFDLPMSEIWPPTPEEALPIPGIQSSMEATQSSDDPTLPSSVRRDAERIPSPRQSAYVPKPGLREATITNPTNTAQTSLTDATISYVPPLDGTGPTSIPTGMSPAQSAPSAAPAAPARNIPLIVGAVLVPVFLGGITMGIIVLNKKGAEEERNQQQQIAQVTPTPRAEDPAATPTVPVEVAPTPEPAIAATPTPQPTPSAIPTPTPDPIIARAGRLKSSFAGATSLLERTAVWVEATHDKNFAGDPRIQEVADEIALVMVLAPEMVDINGVRFTMGSNNPEASPEEKPAHNVTLSGYSIGLYEVTALEFSTFLNATEASLAAKLYRAESADPTSTNSTRNIVLDPARKKYVPVRGRETHPANGVSFLAAEEYCRWLSDRTGKNYRLPTEAQWELAAKGSNTVNVFPWGPTMQPSFANFNSQGTVDVTALPTGRSSAFGLYHMSGNVAEWVQDWYGDRTYERSDATDPVVSEPPAGERRARRVVRGGSFNSLTEKELRTTQRERAEPEKEGSTAKIYDFGFRVVRQ
jgi:serine/threonine protein kinase/formylglycine-generating enzyme required for sulfatase activity